MKLNNETMNRLTYSWLGGMILLAATLLCACDPTPISVSEDVDIEIDVELISAGFLTVKQPLMRSFALFFVRRTATQARMSLR